MKLPSALTRSNVRIDHAFIAPDSHVQSNLPGWSKTKGIILITPQMGARFCQYIANMEKGAVSGLPLLGVQRFFYVIEGKVRLETSAVKQDIDAGGYAYIPANEPHQIKASKVSKLVIFEKFYAEDDAERQPRVVIGHESEVKGDPFLGDPDAVLQVLLPDDGIFDMAVNLFSFKPGATLPFVEVHVMEHGLMLLNGQGVYRLSDNWYPIEAGDVIWMAPYCPQWFVAAGKTSSRYIYYKDVARDPLRMDG